MIRRAWSGAWEDVPFRRVRLGGPGPTHDPAADPGVWSLVNFPPLLGSRSRHCWFSSLPWSWDPWDWYDGLVKDSTNQTAYAQEDATVRSFLLYFICILQCIFVCMCMYVQVYTCMSLCANVHIMCMVYVSMHVFVCVPVHVHAYMYAYTPLVFRTFDT